SGNRAVDVDRKLPAEVRHLVGEHALDDTDQSDVFALELELEGHLKEPRGARIVRMNAVAESRRYFVVADPVVDDRFGRFLERSAISGERKTAVEKPHARLDVAAMTRSEREHAGADRVLQRRPGRRDVAG